MMKQIIVAASLITLGSCSQSDRTVKPEMTQESIIVFKDYDEYSITRNTLNNMSQGELKEWEKQKKIVSYRAVLLQAYDQLINSTSEVEFSKTLSSFSDVLVLTDSVIRPKIEYGFYQKIANRQGYFRTGNNLNRVIGETLYSVAVENSNLLENPDPSNPLVFANQYILNETKFLNNARINSTCSSSEQAEYFDNHSGCNNDRRVYIFLKSIKDCTVFSSTFCQQSVQAEVDGLTRSYFCTWASYKTSLSYRNINFSLNGLTDLGNNNYSGTTFNVTFPDNSTLSDDIMLFHEQNVGDRYPVGVPINPIIPFNFAHAEGTSRGVNGGWAIIDCQ